MCYTATTLRYLGVLPVIPPHERGRRCVRALRRLCMRIPTGSELGSPQGRSSTLLQLPSREESLDTGDSADREQSPCEALFSDPQRVGRSSRRRGTPGSQHTSELRAWHHHSSLLTSCIAFQTLPSVEATSRDLNPRREDSNSRRVGLGCCWPLLLAASAAETQRSPQLEAACSSPGQPEGAGPGVRVVYVRPY